MKEKILVGFSGGETSAYLAQWLKKNKSDVYEFYFAFANTGQENEETLLFVDQCDKQFGLSVVWLEAVINPENGKGTRHKIVDFKTADRTGVVFENHIKKYGIPNKANLACSRELKANVLKSYMKSLGVKRKEYHTAIGIRTDEIDRISSRKDVENIIYPLITMQPMTKQTINFWWSQQSFRLKLKGYEGNCKVCHKKSLRKLMTIAAEKPEQFDWILSMEKKYENFIPPTHQQNKKIKLPVRFFREHLSASDIIQMSKQPFNKASDDSKKFNIQTELFGVDLDVSQGCVESCEPY